MEFAQLYPGFTPDNPSINTPIEPGVKPLCDALNSLHGVYTVWSCEGHPNRGAAPFVIFVTDQATAFKVTSVIAADRDETGLHFNWWTTATFREDGSLQYAIKPDDYRIPSGTWWRFWPLPRWSQRVMMNDLARLAELVSQLKH